MTASDLTVTVTVADRGPDIEVVVVGELDMLSATDLAATLQGAAGTRDVVVDLAGVTFIDSIALGDLMRAERASVSRGDPCGSRTRPPSSAASSP